MVDPIDDVSVVLCGELDPWPTRDRLTAILTAGGLTVGGGRYALRVGGEASFSFEHYGGDRGEPVISADAGSLEEMLLTAGPVSRALSAAGHRHRFEIYRQGSQTEFHYLHHAWPKKST